MEFKEIEAKWQNLWEEAKLFEVSEDSKKEKFYLLEMFPYPSGEGLHMGHALNFVIGDVLARYKIMNGFNVLHPMGFDALGLPAENAAIKAGTHPKDYTDKAIKNYIKQQRALGITYAWNRVVNTASTDYYKWDQWIFLKMYEKGLVYQKESSVNWCPLCDTVLANEQVQNGKCWRHDDTDVQIKKLKQWFLKITDYADELYEGIDKLEGWPNKTRAMQKNWIGKSYGTEIEFEINGSVWPIFTTRPDTIYGVTFMVVSAQHNNLFDLVTDEQKEEVNNFLKKLKSVSEKELESMEKEGVFTGSYATNPVNGEKVPVYAGNFVVADYGAGMVMAVPAHDQRDFEFAKKYGIKIKEVIIPKRIDKINVPKEGEEFVERKAIQGIVYDPKTKKYLCLKWKNHPWTTFVTGGIEDGEDVITAAKREIIEETGYKNLKFERLLGTAQAEFYAAHKKENRRANFSGVLFSLENEERNNVSEEEKAIHEVEWKSINEINDKTMTCAELDVWLLRLKKDEAYTEDGVLIDSEKFDGLNNREAIKKITDFLAEQNKGKSVVNFKLRDWGISRQRYWGTPIPMIHCDVCGAVPVEEKDLPVVLPQNVTFGKGNPLETNESWIKTKCPVCGIDARRETDTMDTFVNSSWYFLRYADPKNDKEIFDKKKAAYWCPVDQYVGGAEHACMHLIYSRFYTKFLADLGLINFREPAKKLFHQGMLAGEGGIKMSKSKGNVVVPEVVSEKYGIDASRFFLLSLAAPDKPRDWSDKGIIGSVKFINKIIEYFSNVKFGDDSKQTLSKLNKTIKEVSNEIEEFKYNISLIKIRQLFEHIETQTISKDTAEKFLKLFSPFCPHVAEELWEVIGNEKFISNVPWPEFDESLIDEQLEKIESVIENIRSDILTIKDLAKLEKISKVKIIVAPKWKWDALQIVKEVCVDKPDFGLAMKSLMSNDEMKKHGQEIQGFLKVVISKLSELSELKEFDEFALLESIKPQLEKEFGVIEIEKAENSKEAKVKNAFPAKPALIVE
ncbi:MAG: class I tRNA ligase family protein [archaeon]|jgi:leucyl-tRNA synthetase